MRKSWTWLVCGIVLVAANAMLAMNADARPPYDKEFWNLYPTLKDLKEATKCGACHGQDKKVRNDYGKAVHKALGGEKVADVEKIKEALKKVESEKSGTEGKTFGDLINDGKLPGKL